MNSLKRKLSYNVKKILFKISEEKTLKLIYLINTHKKLNIKNPTTFNEKIQWLKLNWKSNLVVMCTDKYLVREYVKSKGLSGILNELYFVFNDTDEIKWSELPASFALKTNNGCKSVVIAKDKNDLNELEVKEKMRAWLDEDFGLYSIEPHYSQIEPKIICEKYIENSKGEFPVDYKFFCFNGEPKFLALIDERDSSDNYKRYFIDLDWNLLNLDKDNNNISYIPEKPESFDKMIQTARILATDFPFVRVDLYELEKKVVFGELTFTPVSGMATYFTDEAQLEIGNLIKLPEVLKEY
ncbi:ATP-grasp fold amidoligase family protein [Vagococcus lutrae]|uniref:ATP-grasp fold amidoligase family protein n=1 Tax=Vagococcus lutrae TaxID=81947 RepID=UPI00289113FE|nr:ATP-grasp fold amidoligase family protein [Vagococcus lutrae]MDT2805865.1 ATP-grasp fold amidoligase family protein [Vagococcus lutrae]